MTARPSPRRRSSTCSGRAERRHFTLVATLALGLLVDRGFLADSSRAHADVPPAARAAHAKSLACFEDLRFECALREAERGAALVGAPAKDDDAARRLQTVLTNDPGTGIARHADAGYDLALEVATRQGVDLGGPDRSV